MSYTNATVVIAASVQAVAGVDFPGSFKSGFYEAIDGADHTVATHYICSGMWTDDDLSKVVNDVTWTRRVYFGEVQSALHTLGLNPIESSAL